ncbi:MAG: hypothetical protein NTV46_00435, partial [Verrucomicrobia bacterium]|nr:hypothetical protein [Verrucomicrobiota bacterium]
RNDFLWVSGTWRALPPGREWMAGYWGKCTDGYQWTSGYWANATSEETTYLPAPPKTLEDGPSTKAPSNDHRWSPGSWVWRQQRYAWSPGYWALGRADWDWMPSHYVWTPRGYIFVDGYWDYTVARRGMLFAPIFFNAGLYSRPGYHYSPSIVLDLALFAEHLFLRPHYHHYYFGDYYALHYGRGGYYAAYAYHSHRFGYDPIYCHQRWEHRADHGWHQRVETNFKYRRDHEDARPPRTWDAMRKLDANTADSKKHGMKMADPIDHLAKQKDGPVKLQKVAKEDREMLVQRDKEVRKTRDERRTLETKGVDTAALKPGELAEPTKVKLPKSPIVGKPTSELTKNQLPPAIPKSPKTLVDEPKSVTAGRLPKGDKNNPQLDPRKIDKSNNTDLTPREPKGKDTVEPRKIDKTDLTPREPKGKNTIEPRKIDKTDLTPREPKGKNTIEPRKIEVTPRTTKVQPTPQPRRIEAMPRETKVQPTPQPRVKSNPIPNESSDDKSGKKRKKDATLN